MDRQRVGFMTYSHHVAKPAQRSYHLKLHLLAYILVLVFAVVLPIMAQA